MWLKRIGEKKCSQRFHAIYIVFEVVNFQMFSLLLMKQIKKVKYSFDIQRKFSQFSFLYTL